MSKDKPQDGVARVAAEVASKIALEFYTREQQKGKQQRINRRLRDTKRLMRNYREIKIHAGDAIASLSEVVTEDYEFFRDLMENDDIDVVAIKRSKARSAIMLAHIDSMLHTYEQICYASKKPEEQRRYRVLEAMCLLDEPLQVGDIADKEGIDNRTVYKDFEAACDKMGALLFGIQSIDRE